MTESSDLQTRLEELRQDYAKQLPDKIDQINETISNLTEPSGENIRMLHRQAHSLVGSGATFGFSALSMAARSLESFVKQAIDQSLPIEEIRGRIEQLFLDLKHASFLPDTDTEVTAEPYIRNGVKPDHDRLIYVLESTKHVAINMSIQLGHFGYHVEIFESCDKLMAETSSRVPAAIVVGIQLNNDNSAGIHCIESGLRSESGERMDIPVVFFSNRDDFPTRLHCVRAGGKAYYTEPVDITSLASALDSLTGTAFPEPFRILVVDDSEALATLHATTLEKAGMVTHIVCDPLKVMQSLEDFSPDLILMDVYMPSCSGIEMAEVIRQKEAYVGIPIVFLSSETDVSKQMAALKLGGDDFLTKPIRPDHLVASLASRAHRSRILRSYIVRDSLTGLLNHTAFTQGLENEIQRAMRKESQFCVAMIDIDKFKLINDSYGHSIGDHVIQSLAGLLQQRLRKTDIIGRYGGEEFAVILPDTDLSSAQSIMSEIREGFAQIDQYAHESSFHTTFSCGIAAYPGFSTAVELVHAADKAMYEAKHQGRNRVILAQEQGKL